MDYEIDYKNFKIDTPCNNIPYSKQICCENGITLQSMKKRPSKKSEKIFRKMARNLMYETSLDSPPTSCNNLAGYEEFIIYKNDYQNYYAIGGICITKFNHKFKNQWAIQWVWIHPFTRGKGILKTIVNFLEKQYGILAVNDVLTLEMECFANKYNKNYNIMFNSNCCKYREAMFKTVKNLPQ